MNETISPKGKTCLTISLPQELTQKLDDKAKREYRSKQSIVRELLAQIN